jgi:hypothetical protein
MLWPAKDSPDQAASFRISMTSPAAADRLRVRAGEDRQHRVRADQLKMFLADIGETPRQAKPGDEGRKGLAGVEFRCAERSRDPF